MPLLDEVSAHAQLIGAVNTIVPVTKGGETKLLGENTDWLGLRDLILSSLSAANERTESSTSLVLGAGGTSRAAVYALHKAGFKTIYLFNRTRPNAEKLIASFPADYNIIPLTSLDSFPGELPIAIVSTIPGQGTATEHAPNPEAGVTIPASILAREAGGVVVDVSSAQTPLLEGCPSLTNGCLNRSPTSPRSLR